VLSDNSLMNGFALQSKPVDADIVREIGRDFDFGRSPAPARPGGAIAGARGPHLALAAPPDRGLREELADALDEVVDDADLPAVAQAVGDSGGTGAIAPMPRKRRFLFF